MNQSTLEPVICSVAKIVRHHPPAIDIDIYYRTLEESVETLKQWEESGNFEWNVSRSIIRDGWGDEGS